MVRIHQINQMTSEITQHRIGKPSPMAFHLAAPLLAYYSAIIAAPKFKDPDFPWHEELRDEVNKINGELDQILLSKIAFERLGAMASGMRKWQSHPFRRKSEVMPVIWQKGSTSLLDYSGCQQASNPDGPVIMVIPSLINKSYILDLSRECSLIRFLASKGFRVMLLDWGEPGAEEQDFSFNSYGSERLLPAIKAASDACGGKIGVLGYCMGGTLATGILARESDRISAFASIGSPWDFSTSKGVSGLFAKLGQGEGKDKLNEALDILGGSFGLIPSEVFQYMFASINPMQAAGKFARFNEMDQSSKKAEQFVAIEDWLADDVNMPLPATKDLLIDWHIDNSTGNNSWTLLGEKVDLAAIPQPSLVICGSKDTIAPPDSANALANGLPNSKLLTPELGHVGMIVSDKAKSAVWQPLAKFFADTLT